MPLKFINNLKKTTLLIRKINGIYNNLGRISIFTVIIGFIIISVIFPKNYVKFAYGLETLNCVLFCVVDMTVLCRIKWRFDKFLQKNNTSYVQSRVQYKI